MSKHRLLLRNNINNNGIGGLRRLHRRGWSLSSSSSSRAQQSQPQSQRYYGLGASCSSTATAAATTTTTTGTGTVRRYNNNKSNNNNNKSNTINNTNNNVRNRHHHHSSMLPPLLHFSKDTILSYPRNRETLPGLPTTGSSSSMNTAPIFELKMHVTNRIEFNEDAGHATDTDNNNKNNNEEVSNRSRNFCIYPPTMGRPKNRKRNHTRRLDDRVVVRRLRVVEVADTPL